MADYALIKTINDVETIDNVIVASPEVAATYLIANSGSYEYVLDVANYDPTPGIGWSYDPGLDAFSPPPEDFLGELEAALIAVDTAIENALAAYTACNSEDRSTAVGNVMSDLSEEPELEVDAMVAVITFLEDEAG